MKTKRRTVKSRDVESSSSSSTEPVDVVLMKVARSKTRNLFSISLDTVASDEEKEKLRRSCLNHARNDKKPTPPQESYAT